MAENRNQDGELLASNNELSNLDELHWKMTRTPSFKKWFGDWQNDPENASKMVDRNGEPLLMYHGSSNFEGDYFDSKKHVKTDC